MEHNCKALVFTCMDFRFRTSIRDYLISMGYKDDYDMVALAGVTKDLAEGNKSGTEIILNQIYASYTLHHAKEILLIHHMDCGDYGGHVAFDNLKVEKAQQIKDMKKSSEIIKDKYPDIEVIMILARINELKEKSIIDFEIIQ